MQARLDRMTLGGSVYDKSKYSGQELLTAIECTAEVICFLRAKSRFQLAITPLWEQLETLNRVELSRIIRARQEREFKQLKKQRDSRAVKKRKS